MRNDLDLTRKILENIRAREDLRPRVVEIPDYDPTLVARHVERLHDDRLIEGSKMEPISKQVSVVLVRDMTSAGHQFLSAIESGDIWARMKSALDPTELGALSLREIASIAGELAIKGVKKKLGLD